VANGFKWARGSSYGYDYGYNYDYAEHGGDAFDSQSRQNGSAPKQPAAKT
jgi:hypothetical protein